MKIYYELIIEEAHQRVKKLQEFQESVIGADEHAQNILKGLLFFASLNLRVEALDPEGKSMLGGIYSRTSRLGAWASNAHRQLTTEDSVGSNNHMLMPLVEMLK